MRCRTELELRFRDHQPLNLADRFSDHGANGVLCDLAQCLGRRAFKRVQKQFCIVLFQEADKGGNRRRLDLVIHVTEAVDGTGLLQLDQRGELVTLNGDDGKVNLLARDFVVKEARVERSLIDARLFVAPWLKIF